MVRESMSTPPVNPRPPSTIEPLFVGQGSRVSDPSLPTENTMTSVPRTTAANENGGITSSIMTNDTVPTTMSHKFRIFKDTGYPKLILQAPEGITLPEAVPADREHGSTT